MMMLLTILVQLSVNLKLSTRSAPHSTLKQLPVYFYLITVLIQFDCFKSQFALEKHFVCFNNSL